MQAAIAQAEPRELRFTRDWICGLHGRAFSAFVDWAGMVRDRDVRVGDHQAPSYYEVPALLEDYCADIEARLSGDGVRELDSLLIETLAFAEWRFLHIHPFRDFNGRIARLLLFALLVRLELPPVALAPVGEGERSRYLAALGAADRGDRRPLEGIWVERLGAVG